MNSEQGEMLLKLAAHLENDVTDENFNMWYWCGTQCCAAGHACTLFPDKIRQISPYSDQTQLLEFKNEDGCTWSCGQTFTQLSRMFGISRDDARFVFGVENAACHRTRVQEVAVIREVVRKYGYMEGACNSK